MWVVGDSGMVGSGPVGARLMIRVRGSDGGSEAAGWFGAVTSTSVIADEKSPLGQPGHRVDPLGAALQHLKVQVRTG